MASFPSARKTSITPEGAKKLQDELFHAEKLAFQHPETQERMVFRSALPEDFKRALRILEE